MKCPHCLGELQEQKQRGISWNYDCLKCGRAWEIDKEGTWHALFDAGSHIYTKKEVEKAQKYEEENQ